MDLRSSRKAVLENRGRADLWGGPRKAKLVRTIKTC